MRVYVLQKSTWHKKTKRPLAKGRFDTNLPSGIIRIPFESSSSIQLPDVRTHQAGGTSLETACQAMSWQLGIVLKKHVFF